MNSSNGLEAAVAKRHLFDPAATVAIDALYTLMTVVGTTCNVAVLIMFCKCKDMRRPYDIFLSNISLANVLSAFSIQPYIWIDVSQINQTGYVARFICAASVGLVFFMTCAVSNSLTLCAITVLRYLTVVKGYSGGMVRSRRLSLGMCIFAWFAGALTRIPGVLSFQYSEKESVCYREFPAYINGRLFATIIAIILMLIPYCLMAVTYIWLALFIWKRSAATDGTNIVASRARRSITALIGFLLVTHAICWAPFFLIWTMGRSFEFFSRGIDGEYNRQRWLRIAMIFALLNSVLDPFMYAFSIPKYRTGIFKIVPLTLKQRD